MCDINETVLDGLGDRYGIRHRCRDIGELVAADLDAVIVATPMPNLVAHTVAALRAGTMDVYRAFDLTLPGLLSERSLAGG